MEIEMLDFAKNEHGLIVNQPDVMEKLTALINNPCAENWWKALDIILDGTEMNLLYGVVKVCPSFLAFKNGISDWSEIPSKEVIVRAIKYVVFIKGKTFQN